MRPGHKSKEADLQTGAQRGSLLSPIIVWIACDDVSPAVAAIAECLDEQANLGRQLVSECASGADEAPDRRDHSRRIEPRHRFAQASGGADRVRRRVGHPLRDRQGHASSARELGPVGAKVDDVRLLAVLPRLAKPRSRIAIAVGLMRWSAWRCRHCASSRSLSTTT